MGHTKGPWFVSGVRFRMNGGNWHSVNRYDEATKSDDNICCVGYDPRTGVGLADARLIAAAPDLLAALKAVVSVADRATVEFDAARAAIARAEGSAS
jgi:hypothetical protein